VNVGWVGLGKLGLPIAEEIAKTHTVLGHDVRSHLHLDRVQRSTPGEMCDRSDLIFVAVQTPHEPEFEGVTRIPDTRSDFDYTHLVAAVRDLADTSPARPPLVIISTVLPGTIEREILPLWDGPVVYNPLFIAMGEEVADFLDPEFVLLGQEHQISDHGDVCAPLLDFYESLGLAGRIFTVGYREAELAKMAYNTFIGLKIAFANTIGELCHRLEIDADQVIDVLKSGSKRIVSDRYLEPGMGDGGPCHPRDNIALSWLARETGMSFDLFGAIMEQREQHTKFLRGLIVQEMWEASGTASDFSEQGGTVTLLGKAYKPGSKLQTGSPALLLANLMDRTGMDFEHEEDPA
jgi:UDPglucose 6-dehydrogenase